MLVKNKFILGALVMSVAGFAANAQEFQENVEEPLPQMVETQDPGANAVMEAQEYPITPEPAESAEDQINNFLTAKDWSTGWDKDKKRMFVIGSYEFTSEDPSYDDSFVAKREMAATIAILRAKAEVIEMIKSEVSASVKFEIPGTDVNADLRKKHQKSINKIAAQRKKLIALCREYKLAEADKLAGVTWGDRSKALMDAAIKKLDSKFNAEKIEEKKLKKFEKIKKLYDEGQNTLSSLEESYKSATGNITAKAESSVTQLASMPLYGAVTIAQSESWNEEDDKFQVAVLLTWSAKLERAARAISTMEDFTLKPSSKKKLSVRKWLASQSLATMVGSRQYLDAEGRRYFLGITARQLTGKSSSDRKLRGLADMGAKRMCMFSIMGDLNSFKEAKTLMEERSGETLSSKDHSEIAESYEEKIEQSIDAKPVSGLSKFYYKTVVHPISQQKMYVTVWGIDASSITDLKRVEDRNYATRAAQGRTAQYEKGRKAAQEQTVKNADNDRESFNKGHSDATATQSKLRSEDEAVKRAKQLAVQRAAAAKIKAAQAQKRAEYQKRQKAKSQGGRSQDGVFSGDSDVDDDF